MEEFKKQHRAHILTFAAIQIKKINRSGTKPKCKVKTFSRNCV